MAQILVMINTLFDVIPFTGNHAGRYAAIILLSAISAVVFMVLYKKVSNQEGITREKARIIGNIFQMRLYKDHLLLIVTSIFNVFKHNLFYLRYMLVPLIAVIIPLMIITVQVNQRCGYTPFKSGDEFILTATVTEDNLLDTIECLTTSGIELLTPAVRVYEERRAFWRGRIKPAADTDEAVSFFAGGKEIGTKTIAANHGKKRFTTRTMKAGSFDALLYNAEGFFPADASLESVTIPYPRTMYNFLGISMDSIVLYFVLTLLFALIIKPFFNVVI